MNTETNSDAPAVESTALFARIVSDPKRGDTVGDYTVKERQGNYVNYAIGNKSHNVSLAVWAAIAHNSKANTKDQASRSD